MADNDFLERIALNERFISFTRMSTTSANYYHWHQCLEILFVMRGYGIVIVDNQQYTLRPGRMFIFPPFKLHKVYVEQGPANPYERTTLHIENVVIDTALQPFPKRRAIFRQLCDTQSLARIYDLSEHSDHLDYLLENFHTLCRHGTHQLEDIVVLVLQLMAFMPEQGVHHHAFPHTTATKVMNWIEENYDCKFSLERLAQAVGLSRSYTSRVFSQETGGSIQEYLVTRRVKCACELLRGTDLTIEQIGQKSGFADTPYFITSFKKLIGQTPLQYRKTSCQPDPRLT
ncbi:AraC family transcriptional regulator [Chimaeribacter arupi]|uniref:AraC family transcriptional regulator n=1 Tax=Chimaeribacter arupi TaxID=2060066 RepID=UPI000C7CEE26|nr:AraC family transcriptional regulator [Chimaeribacter arupi]PLR42238.1 AraC family transcriptional regulator [Chimaeribacter arupi]